MFICFTQVEGALKTTLTHQYLDKCPTSSNQHLIAYDEWQQNSGVFGEAERSIPRKLSSSSTVHGHLEKPHSHHIHQNCGQEKDLWESPWTKSSFTSTYKIPMAWLFSSDLNVSSDTDLLPSVVTQTQICIHMDELKKN